MDNYLSKINTGDKDEYCINFTALRAFFPDIVKESEHGGYVLKNDSENQVILDFSNARGKEIRLSPNHSKVAKSNMSWEKANQEEGFDIVSGGLFLEGSFKVRGSIGNEPVFIGDNLDRAINFKGTGAEECVVEDIIFIGLNAFKQDQRGGQDCPDPAFINGDNVNLEINGIKINYILIESDWADETNSQLTKGIILHNTDNNRPIQMLVSHTIINGLQWDAICANGLAKIIVNKSRLIQNSSYKQSRGVGVASTFNSPEGSISITNSEVNYCKGTSIWINEKTYLPRRISNLGIRDTTICNSGWAIFIDADQKTILNNLNVLPDYNGGLQQDYIYCPLDFNWKGNKFDMSFENLNFSLSSEMGDVIKLMSFENWENFADFSNTTPQEFFDKRFGYWGNVSVKIDGEEYKLQKEQFAKFINNFKSTENLNPSRMVLQFDVKQKQFVVLFATEFDTQSGSRGFSEPYYLGKQTKQAKLHGRFNF